MVPRCPPVPSRPGAARRPDGQPRLGAIRRPRLPLPMRWFGGRVALLLGLGSGLAGWAPAAATGASGGDAGAPAMVAAGMPTPAVPALTGDRTSAHDLRRWWKGSGDLDGVWSHLLLLVAVLPPLLPVSLWELFAIDWINLIGPGEMAVLVGSRPVTALLIDLPIDLLEEAIGQVLPVRRHADASGQIQIRHRKGSGQLLTLARTAGGLTSLTLLASASGWMARSSPAIAAQSAPGPAAPRAGSARWACVWFAWRGTTARCSRFPSPRWPPKCWPTIASAPASPQPRPGRSPAHRCGGAAGAGAPGARRPPRTGRCEGAAGVGRCRLADHAQRAPARGVRCC